MKTLTDILHQLTEISNVPLPELNGYSSLDILKEWKDDTQSDPRLMPCHFTFSSIHLENYNQDKMFEKHLKKVRFFRLVADNLIYLAELTFVNNARQLYYLPSEQFESLDHLIQELKIPSEAAFARGGFGVIQREEWDNLKKYNNETWENYYCLHQDIAMRIKHYIDSFQTPIDNILIVDIGTGTGGALDAAMQHLKGLKNLQGLGIDYNAMNIKEAKQLYTNYEFKVANISETKNIISQRATANQLVIVIASGILTRLVISGTVESLKILQAIYRVCNFVVITGITEVLLTLRIAKQIGWTASLSGCEVPHSGIASVYTLTKSISIDKLISKTISTECLNLSLHAHPLAVLKEIEHTNAQLLRTINVVDISLANLEKDEINAFLELLPSLNRILISGTEKFVRALLELERAVKVVFREYEYLAGHMENRELKSMPNTFFKRPGFNP